MEWIKFNKFLYKYWRQQIIVIVIGLIMVPLSLVNPYLTKLVIDRAYGGRDLKLFFILSGIGAGIFIFRGLVNLFSGYLSKWINSRVFFDMQTAMFNHMQKLPLSFYDNRSTGEYIYRINSDVRAMCNFICNIIPQIITFLPRLVFILIIVFVMNWKLALLVTLLVPITYIHPYFFGKKLRDASKKTIQKSQNIFKELQEIFTHIKLIKALGTQDKENIRYRDNLSKRLSLELKRERISRISEFCAAILNKIVMGVIAVYGGYQVIAGELTLGSLTAIMIYLTQFTGLLKSVGGMYQKIIVNSVVRARLSEIFSVKPVWEDTAGARDVNIQTADLTFRDVWFGYKRDSYVLRGMSLEIKAGERVAFVGLSGCGKTTAISLLLRLYAPRKGRISLGGLRIDQIKERSFRRQVTVALQQPLLWNDSIAKNIAYNAWGCSLADIRAAAQVVCADEFIDALPDKYNSVIGELACKLSQGQKQRLAVARAIIGRPKLLILDEALSSLDLQTESRVIANIFSMLSETTIIFVSHRLSVARKADKVYFFKDSGVVTSGTHEELLKTESRYRELFQAQL